MRRLQSRGLFAALENEDLNTPPEVVEEDIVLPEGSESLEATSAELNADEGEINSQEDRLEEAEDVVATLESLRDALKQADAEGGLCKAGARVLQISLEHMYNRIQLPEEQRGKLMPALEEFGGAASRQESTQIAMEGMAETAKKVWAAIIEGAKRAWDFIKSWYMKLFDKNTKVANRAKALIAAADKMGEGEPKETVIKNEGLVHALGMADDHNVGQGVTRLAELSKEFASGAKAYFENLGRAMDEVRAGKTVDLKPEQMSFGLSKMEDAHKLGIKLQAGAEVFGSKELPGGNYFVSAWGGTDDSSFVGMVKSRAEFSAVELAVLKRDECKSIAAEVEKITESVASTKSDMEAAGATLEKLIAAGEAHLKGAGEAADEQGQAAVKLARAVQKLVTGAITGANKYILDTCESYLSYVELSIKAHTGTAMGNAAEKAGEAAGKAADAVKDAAGKAGNAVKDAAGKAADAAKGAVNSAAKKVAGATEGGAKE